MCCFYYFFTYILHTYTPHIRLLTIHTTHMNILLLHQIQDIASHRKLLMRVCVCVCVCLLPHFIIWNCCCFLDFLYHLIICIKYKMKMYKREKKGGSKNIFYIIHVCKCKCCFPSFVFFFCVCVVVYLIRVFVLCSENKQNA